MATHSIQPDKSDFSCSTTPLLGQVRLIPIVIVIAFALPRTGPRLPPEQGLVTANATNLLLNMPWDRRIFAAISLSMGQFSPSLIYL